MDKNKKNIEFPIKGLKEGLLITLNDGDWESVQQQLLSQIDQKSGFFAGAKIAIEVGERNLHAAEIAKLRDSLFDREVKLFALLSNSKTTDTNAESLGLKTRKSVFKNRDFILGSASVNGEDAILINRTVRSGSSIEFSGHVVVNGDVNPGGEIIASGSVFVWGKLRGSVYAGFEGSEKEVICALEIDPLNLRIANYYLKMNRIIKKLKKKPAMCLVSNNKIIVENITKAKMS